MHYEITASTQAVRTEMTTAQRKSSLFAEAPRVGAITLRRGQVLKLTPEQFAHRELSLKRLFLAHAIEIFRVEGKSSFSMRDQKRAIDPSPKEVEKAGEGFDAAKAKEDREAVEKLLAEDADAELLKMLSEAPVEKPVETTVETPPAPVETAPVATPVTDPVAHAEAPTVVETVAPAAPPEVIVPPPPPSAPVAAPAHESHGKKGKKGSK